MRTVWNLPIVDLMPFSEIVEGRPTLLVTSAPAWNAVKGQLNLPVVGQIEVSEANSAHWDGLIDEVREPASVVYAVGGGLAADAAKYIALRLEQPLVCLPTALSVDAFFTAASGIRRQGCVYYIETKPPERLILDLDVIAAAPLSIRAAGITDVLSIATGSWDWKFAHERGKNPPGMAFIPWAYDHAQAILTGALDCAEAAGAGDRDGLVMLYNCLAMEVQLCNQLGHARPEEGTEHYIAYALENVIGHGLPHGDLVGPGIMIAASLQGQDTSRLEGALKACHIPLEAIPESAIQQTLEELPGFVRKHGLAYAIAHELKS